MLTKETVSSTEEKTCKVSGCYSHILAKNMCSKHYAQVRRHGKVTPITRYDSNEIHFKNGICIIFLRNIQNEIVGKTIIDISDFHLVSSIKWNLGSHGYATSHQGLLHQILNLNWVMTDHRDLDKLNNKRSNLRKCNYITNGQNVKSRGGTSKYKGVFWNTQQKKWQSKIQINKKPLHLGFFINEEDAAKAYDAQARKSFKSFSKLNFEGTLC